MTPVTIVTGFLGAGKTTLVNHVLSSALDRRIGVLVNDFGSVNIDARLIAGATGDVVALTNGCICCSMRNDVVKAVFRVLEHATPPEHLLVEASGVSSPGSLAEIFLGLERSGTLRLDGIAAIVDAERFPYDALKTEPLARDQVLASDLVVLNKIDLIDEERRAKIEAAIRQRVPHARLIETTMGRVPPDVLLGLARTDRAIEHGHHGEYASFTYVGGELSFKQLAEAIRSFPPSIIRIKGFLAASERPGDRLVLNAVGKRVHVETIGAGDGRSELVVIGTDFDEADVRSKISACEAASR